ncbi:ribosomal protein L1 [Xylariomycetidae sp. FL2044]|nr:ribosomal protein L1 [Xylariomycetidae sp. FL2044]
MTKIQKEKVANAEKKNLLADPDDEEGVKEQSITLTLTTKRHIADSRALKPAKIPLPHPLRSIETDPELQVCLIVAEPQRAYKNLVAADDFPAEWRKAVSRVIDIAKLKAKFKSYESLRQLYSEHDVFLADTRIINRLPKLMGKTFYKNTTKRPVPVEIQARVKKGADGKRVKRAKGDDTINCCTPPQLAGEIQRAVGAALVSLTPSTNTAVRVAYAGFTADQLAANVNVVSRVLVDKFVPGKWKNIKSIYIKGPETVALPIWLTDELWVDGQTDIVADDSEAAKALLSSEKANVGKKRKSLEGQVQEAEPVAKKAKKTTSSSTAKAAKLPESNDAKLDKEIADRKAALKKQKKAAKKALEA